jgi:hypothetical protein
VSPKFVFDFSNAVSLGSRCDPIAVASRFCGRRFENEALADRWQSGGMVFFAGRNPVFRRF